MADKYKSNNTDDFPIFLQIGKTKIEKMLAKTVKLTNNIASVLRINNDEIVFSEDILIEIFDRIEKRRVYFHVFYNGCKMGELNEGALLCFWVVKLQPFFHHKINSLKLNALIAVNIFINTIYFHCDKLRENKKIPHHFINDLYYSLMYRDISKESLMILAESFVDKK